MPDERSAYPPIGDYAIIGDCRSAALVSSDGTLEWLYLPRFDAPSIFAALVDRRLGGRFVVQPAAPYTSVRRYVDDTTVVETTFATDQSRVRLLDLMPVAAEADKRRALSPQHEVLRAVECTVGEVEALCDPRPRYGNVVPRLTDHGPLGY